MREDPLSHKYIKVEDKIGIMVREDISLDHVTEAGAMVQMAVPDRIIKVTDLGEVLEDIVEKGTVEKGTEVRGMVTTTIEIGSDLGRECLQETIEGIEAIAMIGLDQGPELVQIGIG